MLTRQMNEHCGRLLVLEKISLHTIFFPRACSPRLVVGVRREYFSGRFFGWYGGIAFDKSGHDTSSLNTQGQRRDIEEEQILSFL
jgi:hypothetical protein